MVIKEWVVEREKEKKKERESEKGETFFVTVRDHMLVPKSFS